MQYHPYIRPQETGYKTDVRWVALYNSDSAGIFISGKPLVCFSALHLNSSDLDYTVNSVISHTTDISFRDDIFLYIDLNQTGIGGDNILDTDYTLPCKKYNYSFSILPFDRTNNPLLK